MAQKTRILYVHHSGNLGGAPRSLSFLLGKLNLEKFAAQLLCIATGPGIEIFKNRPFDLIFNTKIFPFHGSTVSGMTLKLFLTNFLRLPQSYFAARRTLQKTLPQIIHINSSCLFIVAFAAKILDKNIKVVCHVREPLLPNSLSGSIIRFFCYHYVDEFIAIDSFSANSMKAKNPITIVYNAVNFEEYNSDFTSNILREELKLRPQNVVFLYLARFAPSNGTLMLVDVAKKITKTHPDFHFVIAGLKTDIKNAYVEKVMAAASDTPNIHLIPFRTDVPEVIASSDILVVPFTRPHFARSVVEASAMGKLSIGSNLGGIDELIVHEETGFLFNSKEELYNYCVLSGIDSQLRMTMGKKAVLFAKENFDNNVSSYRVFEVYKRLTQDMVLKDKVMQND